MEQKKQIKISLKTIILVIFILLVIIILFISLSRKHKAPSKLQQNQSEKNPLYSSDSLSLRLLKLENSNENFVYSPLSVKYALSMLKDGAVGTTKSQIETVLGDSDLPKYNNVDDKLSLANSIFIRDFYTDEIKDDFKNTLISNYRADINFDTFENAQNVNNWIEEKTFGMIKNVVPDSLLQYPYTKMVLINALAIDMDWESTFDSTTDSQTFIMNDGTEQQVSMMHEKTLTDDVSYYKNDNVTAFTKDLQKLDDNTQLQFVVIMPHQNLKNYIENISKNDIDNIISNATLASETENGVSISVPRFSYEYDYENLKNDLFKLGIVNAFNESLSDFSNITDFNFEVTGMLHKSNIAFGESGIKAAATTVATTGITSIAPIQKEPEIIQINKPFLYLIRDKNNGEIWFIGTVYEPEFWGQNLDND